MEQNKYYVPKIEEFRVGFHYEQLVYDNVTDSYGWRFEEIMYYTNLQEVWDNLGDTLDGKDGNILISKIRVKFLDSSDIEELGFVITKNYNCELNAQYLKEDLKFWELSYDLEDHVLEIEEFYQTKMCAEISYKINPNLYDSRTIFSGIIKNKSELKYLLKEQLQII